MQEVAEGHDCRQLGNRPGELQWIDESAWQLAWHSGVTSSTSFKVTGYTDSKTRSVNKRDSGGELRAKRARKKYEAHQPKEINREKSKQDERVNHE
jgi:hypothetical protein